MMSHHRSPILEWRERSTLLTMTEMIHEATRPKPPKSTPIASKAPWHPAANRHKDPAKMLAEILPSFFYFKKKGSQMKISITIANMKLSMKDNVKKRL